MIVLGIDPGLDGAYAVLGNGTAGVYDLPTKRDEVTGRRIDGPQLAKMLQHRLAGQGDVLVCIEQLLASSGRGDRENSFSSVGSQFWTQSAIVTTLEILGLQVAEHVSTQTWKKLFGLTGKDKDPRESTRRAREIAANLYPELADYVQRAKDHNRAEAILIAHWFRKVRA